MEKRLQGLFIAQHQGKRDYQEDYIDFKVFEVDEKKSITLALADGMGGHVGGATASRLVVEGVLDRSSHLLEDQNNIEATLAEAIEIANGGLEYHLSDHPELNGMGTTLILACIRRDGIAFGSVGDSPLWLFRGGELVRLNEDHSMAPVLDELARMGRMSKEQALSDSKRNSLRSAIMGEEIELMDISPDFVDLESDDLIFAASDGVETLTQDEIIDIFSRSDDVLVIGQSIMKAILAANTQNQDNITIAVMNVGEFFAKRKAAPTEQSPVHIKNKLSGPLMESERESISFGFLGKSIAVLGIFAVGMFVGLNLFDKIQPPKTHPVIAPAPTGEAAIPQDTVVADEGEEEPESDTVLGVQQDADDEVISGSDKTEPSDLLSETETRAGGDNSEPDNPSEGPEPSLSGEMEVLQTEPTELLEERDAEVRKRSVVGNLIRRHLREQENQSRPVVESSELVDDLEPTRGEEE